MTTFLYSSYKFSDFFLPGCSLRLVFKMLRAVFFTIFVSSNVWGQYVIPSSIPELWTVRSTPWDKFSSQSGVTVLSPPWLKIIKDSIKLNDPDKLLTRSSPIIINTDWTGLDLKTPEIKRDDLCLKYGIGCFDVVRLDEKKDEIRRKEEAMNEMIMRDELCRKMGIECRKNDMCEKMGVMCTKEEMCKKMGMDCSKKDICELMGIDCKREDMCEKMGVMCTMDDMCKKKGIACNEPVLQKTLPTLPIKGDFIWVKDEFGRPLLMDADGRRFTQLTHW